MALVAMRETLAKALEEGYATGYFESWDQWSLEGVLEAAEEVRSPVILGFGGATVNLKWLDKRGLPMLAALGRTAAETSGVPVSLMLNEVPSLDHVQRGLALGFNAVMLDASHLPMKENMGLTRKAVLMAHEAGADAEGECGRIPDGSAENNRRAICLTDPGEALLYAESTGVDALAVSAGSVHMSSGGRDRIDISLLARIREKVRIPLVLHGGTGIADEDIPSVIRQGVVKINVGTVLKQIFLETVRESSIGAVGDDVQKIMGSRKNKDILEKAKNRMKTEVKRRMRIYGSAGRA